MTSVTPARALLTGHPALATLACSTNVASPSPGTSPTVTRAILVIVGPSTVSCHVASSSRSPAGARPGPAC